VTQPPIVPGYSEPQPPATPPAPPKAGLSGGRIAAIVAVCAGIPLLLCGGVLTAWTIIGGSDSPTVASTSGPHPDVALDDAKLTSCSTEFGIATSGVRVTNSTKSRKYYTVTVRFTNSDGDKIGTGSIYLGSIDPGQSAVDDVSTFVGKGQTAARCQVESVVRA
jgi:hypothetical protein